jgi:hypothetical protein
MPDGRNMIDSTMLIPMVSEYTTRRPKTKLVFSKKHKVDCSKSFLTSGELFEVEFDDSYTGKIEQTIMAGYNNVNAESKGIAVPYVNALPYSEILGGFDRQYNTKFGPVKSKFRTNERIASGTQRNEGYRAFGWDWLDTIFVFDGAGDQLIASPEPTVLPSSQNIQVHASAVQSEELPPDVFLTMIDVKLFMEQYGVRNRENMRILGTGHYTYKGKKSGNVQVLECDEQENQTIHQVLFVVTQAIKNHNNGVTRFISCPILGLRGNDKGRLGRISYGRAEYMATADHDTILKYMENVERLYAIRNQAFPFRTAYLYASDAAEKIWHQIYAGAKIENIEEEPEQSPKQQQKELKDCQILLE